MLRPRVVNVVGFMMASLVLPIVLMTKFTYGMWITFTVIALAFLVQLGIRRHHDTIRKQLHVEDWLKRCTLPTRVRALVLVLNLPKVSMRAIMAMRSSYPSAPEFIPVVAGEEEGRRVREDQEQSVVLLPLALLSSPYRDLTHIVLQHIRGLRH